MAKYVYTGIESSGKSLVLAWVALGLLERNAHWVKKYQFYRPLYSNLKFSKAIEDKYPGLIYYWQDVREIRDVTGADIIWDEISTDLSALKREPLPRQMNRWLRQGAKQGVHIYATAQEFHDIHLDFRRRVHEAYKMTKIMGARRPGKNLPYKSKPWGVLWKSRLEINPYNELEPQTSIGVPFLIRKKRVQCFDTNQTIQTSDEIPYEHIIKDCERENCKDLSKHKKVLHR